MIAPNAVSVTICLRVQPLGEPGVQRVVDRVRIGGEPAPEVDDQLVELVKRQ